MRIKLILLIVASLFSKYSNAQSISSALSMNRKEDIRNGRVHKITEISTYFGVEGKVITKNIQELNDNKQVISEDRFKDGKREARYKAIYDSLTHKLKSRTIERWHSSLGYSIEKAVYL